MKKWPNLLLVSGTSRNAGKTTFACKLIKHIAKSNTVVAIKITPHFHELGCFANVLYKSEELVISQEMDTDIPKDSSKMLAAGASKVYYIQGDDSQLEKVIDYLKPLIPNTNAIVCESAALRSIAEPGILVFMSIDRSLPIKKNSDKISLADYHYWDYNYSIEDFDFNDGEWKNKKSNSIA